MQNKQKNEEFEGYLSKIFGKISKESSSATLEKDLEEMFTAFSPHEKDLPHEGYMLLYEIDDFVKGECRKDELLSSYFEYLHKHKK